jgi:hypothetical protein
LKDMTGIAKGAGVVQTIGIAVGMGDGLVSGIGGIHLS